ncbi:MAG: HEAT repeat domain-containing protein [Planctomycetes bacterium]|nr:HEAT repeat domain-containing protein [Planctomycetota bacterium]
MAESKFETLLPGMGSDNLDERKRAQLALEAMVHTAGRPGADAERGALAGEIAAKLGGDTPKTARVWLLKNLQFIGRDECVEAEAKLLQDPDAELRDCARRALAHNPVSKAGDALRKALGAAKDSAWRVALLNALGDRREASSIRLVAEFVEMPDEAVAVAAAKALGKIGGINAAKILSAAKGKAGAKVKPAMADALLACAEGLAAAGKTADAERIYRELRDPAEPSMVRDAAVRGLAGLKGK